MSIHYHDDIMVSRWRLKSQTHQCLPNRLFGRRSKKTSKLRVTGLCVRNSPRTGEFPAQMASNAGNVSIWWRHHVMPQYLRNQQCSHSHTQWTQCSLPLDWDSVCHKNHECCNRHIASPQQCVPLMPLCHWSLVLQSWKSQNEISVWVRRQILQC